MDRAAVSSQPPRGIAHYRVIAGSDFSELGDRAVIEALRFCAPHRNAELHVITVGAQGPGGIIMPGYRELMNDDDAHEIARVRLAYLIDEFTQREQRLEFSKVAYYVAVGSPAERIVTLANVIDADLIVLGTHGRHGLERIVMGNVATEVVENAPCGVFVIRPRDFLEGERVPEIQPPLQPGEHPLMAQRFPPTHHYVHRMSVDTTPIMP